MAIGSPRQGKLPLLTDDSDRNHLIDAIEAGLADLRAGRFHTHADVFAEMRKRFLLHDDSMIQDESGDLDECDRKALDAAISRSLEQAARGEVNPAEQILARLRERSTSQRGSGPRSDADMTDDAYRLLELAVKLPASKRAAIVAILIDSLGDSSSPEDIEAAWIAEVERRREDLRSGRTKAVPYEEVRRELDAIIERARQRRASSG